MKLKKYHFKKVKSTNDTSLRLIKLGNSNGAILTESQSKGRGQRNNKWISKKDSKSIRFRAIYSIILAGFSYS